MSTRANIIIKERVNGKFQNEVILYSHYDGYPEGVGEDLEDTIENFRYEMCEHNIAKLIAIIMSSKDFNYKYTDALHGDIEYLYEIIFDKENKQFEYNIYKINDFPYDSNEYKNNVVIKSEVFEIV